LVGVLVLVAMDVLVSGTDVQLLNGGLDLHVQIKVGTEECTRRWVWLGDETARSRESSLIVQEESETAQRLDIKIAGEVVQETEAGQLAIAFGPEGTWGRGSLVDKVRDWFQGGNWPRTSCKLKTLNPDWEGEEIALTLKKCRVKADAMLYLVLVDYDVLGNDDFMCAAALNLSEVIRMNQIDEYQKVVQIDRRVLSYGKVAGRIQYLGDIEMEQTSMAFKDRL
jgi:hypothetical protein